VNAKDKINLTNPWHFLAIGFGSGLSPIIPGTMGTLMAVPCYYVLSYLPFWAYLTVVVVGAVMGIVICQKTSDDMGVHDHGSIVWDEFIGYWITMAAVPFLSSELTAANWIWTGFVLFRFFDMVKPWPIKWLDRHVHGGLGIMADDILAGIISAACLFGIGYYFSW
jgi:phosphatidylglycerophosphatase A